MSNFTVLNIKRQEEENSDEVKKRAANVAVEIAPGSRLTFEWDEMFSRYVISLSRFKMDEQLCFAAKVNIMNISTLQAGLNAIVEHIEKNGLTHLLKKP